MLTGEQQELTKAESCIQVVQEIKKHTKEEDPSGAEVKKLTRAMTEWQTKSDHHEKLTKAAKKDLAERLTRTEMLPHKAKDGFKTRIVISQL